MKKQHSIMPSWTCLSIGIIVIIAICFTIMQNNSASAVQVAQATSAPIQETDDILIDNDTITAEFLGFEDHPELDMFIILISVTNKIDKPIWVYMENASVNNDMMQMVMTGMPMYVDPNKSGITGFIFYFKQISIDSINEVEKVSFSLKVADKETMDEIWTSPEVTIENTGVI